VAGVSVTFRLPASSGDHFDGPPKLTATATTNGLGVATSPPIVAGPRPGAVVASAGARGAIGQGVYHLAIKAKPKPKIPPAPKPKPVVHPVPVTG
jgi:hypothetical protein